MNPTAQLEQHEPQAPNASPASREAPEDLRDFPYGRRYIRRVTDDGEVVHDIVPLALEDLLHPEEDDELVSRPGHSRDCRRLFTGLEQFKPKNKTFVIVEDMNVDLGLSDVRAIRPDVSVCEVPAVPDGFQQLGTVDTKQHLAVPLLFIEVTSESTRENDVGPKFTLYEQAKVQQYILVDRAHPSGTPQLAGYEYRGHGLVKQQADSSGRLWLPAFELWVGLKDEQAVLYDEHGIVPSPLELAHQLETERWSGEQHKQRAEKESRRAEKESQRAERATQQREQATQREGQAKTQAEAEKKRADSAEERMREMEAELSRLKGR
ncbi:MAG: Uma2 family endonuclease [Planctomycetota bacterium]|nr:Uma2 family endonuclease [Planctomycetota bacterium]